ncbi:hypothetical protein EKK58_04570 [Candidatus Dependentiae bacterium]|nr:MAG: hypothetical protein EKK58_04570 [Candidatus Dependentiae bacterium]
MHKKIFFVLMLYTFMHCAENSTILENGHKSINKVTSIKKPVKSYRTLNNDIWCIIIKKILYENLDSNSDFKYDALINVDIKKAIDLLNRLKLINVYFFALINKMYPDIINVYLQFIEEQLCTFFYLGQKIILSSPCKAYDLNLEKTFPAFYETYCGVLHMVPNEKIEKIIKHFLPPVLTIPDNQYMLFNPDYMNDYPIDYAYLRMVNDLLKQYFKKKRSIVVITAQQIHELVIGVIMPKEECIPQYCQIDFVYLGKSDNQYCYEIKPRIETAYHEVKLINSNNKSSYCSII